MEGKCKVGNAPNNFYENQATNNVATYHA